MIQSSETAASDYQRRSRSRHRLWVPGESAVDRMSREEWIAEFGEPSVENPNIVDLIEVAPESGQVVLAMIERREWDNGPQQFRQIEEKINRYMGYVLDGHLTSHYPQYKGRSVRIRLDCVQAPCGGAVAFVTAAERAVLAHGLEFVVNVTPARATH